MPTNFYLQKFAQWPSQALHLGTVSNRRAGAGRRIVHIRARLGKRKVAALRCTASIANVGRKYGRTARKRIAGATAASLCVSSGNGNVRAVHVQFTIANSIVPRPREEHRVTCGRVVWQRKAPVGHQRAVSNV